MKQATPALRELARRLLEQEREGRQGARELVDATKRVGQKLRGHLAKLIGSAGFEALLSRALALARAEHPALQGVEAAAEGETSLKGLGEAFRGRGPAEIEAASVAVLANLLWLLATFIGNDLTVRLVHTIWPQVPTGNPGSDSEAAKE